MEKIINKKGLKEGILAFIPFVIFYLLRKKEAFRNIPAMILILVLELLNLWVILEAFSSNFVIILLALLYSFIKGVSFCIEKKSKVEKEWISLIRNLNWLEIAEREFIKESGESSEVKKISFLKRKFKVTAVLPKKVFLELIKNLPFYVFKDINENGEVKADLRNYILKKNKVEIVPFILIYLLLVLGICFIIDYLYPLLSFSIAVIWSVLLLKYIDDSEVYSMPIEEIYRRNNPLANLKSFALFLVFLPIIPSLLINFYFGKILISKKKIKRLIFPNKVSKGREKVKFILDPKLFEVEEEINNFENMGLSLYPVVHEDGFKVSIENLDDCKGTLFNPILVREKEGCILVYVSCGDIRKEEKLIEMVKEIVPSLTKGYIRSKLKTEINE